MKDNEQEAFTEKPNGGGLTRIIKAMGCSFKGFSAAFKYESAFRQELVLCGVLFPFSFLLATSISHWALLVTMLLLVLTIELLNSAIEAITDRVGTDYHVLSGRAKDTASAAVFLGITMMCVIWGAALVEYLS
jgi:diacylglycerol kinase (ATP)